MLVSCLFAFVHDKCYFSRYKVLACFCIFSGRLHRLLVCSENSWDRMRERSDFVGVGQYWQKVSRRKRIRTCVVWYDYVVPDRTRCSCQGKGRKTQIRCASLVSRARIKPGFYGRAEPSAASERAECGDSDIGVIYTPLFLADVTSMRRNSSIVVAKTRSRSYEWHLRQILQRSAVQLACRKTRGSHNKAGQLRPISILSSFVRLFKNTAKVNIYY